MYNYKFLLLDTDHTAYTMTSAGSDGFTTLLPVYLDHIFFPTLTVRILLLLLLSHAISEGGCLTA